MHTLSFSRATKCAMNGYTFCRLRVAMYAGDDKMCRNRPPFHVPEKAMLISEPSMICTDYVQPT